MTIDESGLRVIISASTPILLFLIAIAIFIGEGPFWVAALLIVFGLFFGWFVLMDYGISARLDDQGVLRRCLGKQHRIDWEDVAGFRAGRKGLIVVTQDGKHHILVDRKLAPDELARAEAQARQHEKTLER